MRKWLIELGMIALMTVCGTVAFAMAVTFLMNLGLKLHGNYEYFTWQFYGGYPATALIYIVGVLGFAAPGLVRWHLRHRNPPWQFSLRDLLIATTLIAVLLAIYASVM